MLTPPRPPIDLDAVSQALARAGTSRWRVRVVPETGSTNADLAALARAGEPAGAVLVTDLQTAGRGRQGRGWSAPAGSSLAVSVLLRPDVAAERWGWLPLLAGVAAVDAVRTATGLEAGVEATLKWPNDVLVGSGKLAGLLAEHVPTATGPAAVLGTGLNTTLTTEELPVPTATSLLLAGATTTDRTPVLAALLVQLDRWLSRWEDAGGDARAAGLADAYAARCSTLGRRVRVELPGGGVHEGTAEGVDEDGRLLVDGQAWAAGDVTHLR